MTTGTLTRQDADAARFLVLAVMYRKLTDEGLTTDGSLVGASVTIMKRFDADLLQMLETVYLLAQDSPGPALDLIMNKVRAGVWDSPTKLDAAYTVVTRFCDFLKKNMTLLNSCEDGRTKNAIRGLAVALDSGFREVFLVETASKVRVTKKWAEEAFNALVTLTPAEEIKSEFEMGVVHLQDLERIASDIKEVDRKLRAVGVDPVLQEQRLRLENELFSKADESGNRQAALSIAAKTLYKQGSYLSETGRSIGEITEEQETAMVSEGKVIIAAGAGSGKTKVLAGKVVYHVKEQGVPLEKMIAVAFNTKAAEELRERVIRFGGSSFDAINGMTNFRTTHSFCLDIVRKGMSGMNLITKDSDVASIIDAAIYQVAIGTNSGTLLQKMAEGNLGFVPKGMFDFGQAQNASQAPVNPVAQSAEDFVRSAVRRMVFMGIKHGQSNDPKDHAMLSRMIQADERVFAPMARWSWGDMNAPIDVKPYAMWDAADRQRVNDYIENKAGGSSSARATKSLTDVGLPSSHRFANETKPYSNSFVSSAAVSRNQWFNLGLSDLLVNNAPNRDDERLAEIEGYIGKCLAACVSPEEELASRFDQAVLSGSSYDLDWVIEPAIYAAFQYLKGEARVFTFDDSLVLASKVLIENPGKLAAIRQQYSHVLVDEAQDLNKAQHLVFGLIAGHVDPSTARPYEDGRPMTANTFAFIGDDKQAIYGFRGADSSKFVENSDLRGGDFKTMLLSTNFRSGRAILSAANKLIAYNTDQIPMACTANPARDEGAISYEMGDLQGGELQRTAVDKISEIIAAEGFSKVEYRCGVGTRTNKELAPFALALIAKGIPYYCKKSVLDTSSLSVLIQLLSIASIRKDISADALLGLTSSLRKAAPKAPFKLDAVFRDNLRNQILRHSPSSPVDWFIQQGWNMVYSGSQAFRNARDCKPFADAIFQIRSFKGTPVELMRFILSGTAIDLSPEQEEDIVVEGTVLSETDIEDDGEPEVSALGQVMLDICERYKDLEECLDFCVNIKKMDKDSSSKSMAERRDVVFLGTAHAWKGLEAGHMFLPMTLKGYPHPMAESEEEERRLAYVAITRGRDSVTVLTEPERTNDQGKVIGGPSKFISEACIRPSIGEGALSPEPTEEEIFRTASLMVNFDMPFMPNSLGVNDRNFK